MAGYATATLDYADAYAKVKYYFAKNQWSDGLAFVPPTEEYVNWLLTGTDMDPDEYCSDKTHKIMPRGCIATVGAIRIIQQDMGGAYPGTGTMAIWGGGRTANIFFAEDEEGLPDTWTTLAQDRGYAKNQNVR